MAHRVETIARQDQARELHETGLSWSQVADQLGYATKAGAYEAALSAAKRDPGRGRSERVTIADERLEWAIAETVKVYKRHHYVVAGKDAEVVYNPQTGDPLDDDAPKLEALKVYKALVESKRKLHGDDAPTRKVVELVNESTVDSVIKRLEVEMALKDRA